MIFHNGLEQVLIQWIIIGFESILENETSNLESFKINKLKIRKPNHYIYTK